MLHLAALPFLYFRDHDVLHLLPLRVARRKIVAVQFVCFGSTAVLYIFHRRSTVPYRDVLRCCVLHCTVLCSILHGTAVHCSVVYCGARYGTAERYSYHVLRVLDTIILCSAVMTRTFSSRMVELPSCLGNLRPIAANNEEISSHVASTSALKFSKRPSQSLHVLIQTRILIIPEILPCDFFMYRATFCSMSLHPAGLTLGLDTHPDTKSTLGRTFSR